ncbi:hypothetical protein AYI70_g6558 [Smittium culicis]|uniref:Uncharacterized protein n=1 Tax=Smittium culicis TaxID=133412 RepID=A0A1R1XPF4_9FUNG|nr:hypothetical protein AYI70_g6558 [Smittium culicis]
MRLLLSDACILLTQARLDNLNSGLNLLGRPPQLDHSASELIAANKPANSGAKKLFRGLQHQETSQAAPKTVKTSVTAPVTNQNNMADSSSEQFCNSTGGFRGRRGGGRRVGKERHQ